MAEPTTAYIGLGSNLGDRESSIRKSIKMLAEIEGLEVSQVSELIETDALGDKNHQRYLNTVAEIKTALSAKDLHRKMTDIENSLGRVRQEKWSPRIIDLDLLLFGSEVINSSALTVPHRQMHLRSFVLKGLCRLNPELLHPVIKESMSELAARLSGADFTFNPNLPQLVSVAGIIGVGKTTLTKKLSDTLGCDGIFEAYDTNPFMPDVYAGRKELALDSQLYFLTSRIEQLNHNVLQAGQIYISDYTFDKEAIYAKQTLTAEQLTLYEKIYQPSCAKVSEPVLVIYLTDSTQQCLQRIHGATVRTSRKLRCSFWKALVPVISSSLPIGGAVRLFISQCLSSTVPKTAILSIWQTRFAVTLRCRRKFENGNFKNNRIG